MPSGIVQACSRCRAQKRKCDRRLPACSLCERLKRTCSYPAADGEPQEQQAVAVPVPELQELSVPNIRDTLHKQIAAIVGDGQQCQGWAAVYFTTIHPWFPVICQTSYSNRLLPSRITAETADFCFLTLTMYLVCAKPINGELTSQTRSLYLLLKGLVSTLEAIGINTVEMLQGRLLVTIFEVGHGLYPAAYISSGANVRAAIDMGVNEASRGKLLNIFGSQERAEDAQRTWRGIIVADRYATLERAKGPGHIMEPLSERTKSNGAKAHSVHPQTDILTEMTLASQLLAQALDHKHGTTSNHALKAAEALQILKAGTTFLAECSIRAPMQNAVFASVVAVCRSAVLEIAEYESQPEYRSIAAQDTLHAMINDIAQAAASAVYNRSLVRVDILPVFIPHCLYKAAMVCLQMSRQTGQGDAGSTIRPLVDLLKLISTRWIAAGNYVNEIERLQCTN
ncbi:uncharacterized protein K452DRAFT_77815 [Aplosporella prunicola CBS 121167]|uniref:Zn(2)-C6 fungal-type domain-containing protein n=1 Tax=Aplosporella prunicola CBS 121167 TaxID=1176127 RepID=A0A6A6B877_9PEZI|nr:uncharacterized protein K452DRAFT_77815 [Aplosporella prunicola CBS 121167]KAF2139475.1 hypothetical protein K452DRAFT_77815 [Aplosporella prunicola CBS 121167]